MFQKDIFLVLFANCIPVKGAERSIICDLQHGQFKFIPNDLYVILTRPKVSLVAILEEYGLDNKNVLEEYVNFILDNEFGFLDSEKDLMRFPPLNLEFSTPSNITNIIIELNNESDIFNEKLISQIQELGCKNVQLVAYNTLTVNKLMSVLETFKDSIIKSIELYIKYSCDYVR